MNIGIGWKPQKYQPGTVTAQMRRAGRVEEHYGDLDEHYTKDRMASLVDALAYSTNDKRDNLPNPSKFRFTGTSTAISLPTVTL
jgi:endonuclease